MTSITSVPFESTASKLAFIFACWGLILMPIFAIPSVVMGHIGRKKDKMAMSRSRTAGIALFMGYCEIAAMIALLYLYFGIPHGLGISNELFQELRTK